MKWLFSKLQVKEIDPAESLRRHEARVAIVVDEREAHELREGYIAGSRHIPLGRLQAHVPELLASPEVIFVCRSGNRSASATAALAKAGHGSVYNMAGGMIAWKQKRLPMKQ